MEADIRSLLLDALGLGAWEAESLTGLDLAKKVVERVKWHQQRLEATTMQARRLACDVQELQSGEEMDRLREENARLVAGVRVMLANIRMADDKLTDAPVSASTHLDEAKAAACLVLGGDDTAWGEAERQLRRKARAKATGDLMADQICDVQEMDRLREGLAEAEQECDRLRKALNRICLSPRLSLTGQDDPAARMQEIAADALLDLDTPWRADLDGED